MLGSNNGVHILRADKHGDVVDGVFCTGGLGEGEFNNFDNTGYPSFSEAEEMDNMLEEQFSPVNSEMMVDEPKDKTLCNSIPIPNNATNGDMIKALLLNYKIEDKGGCIYVHYPDGGWIPFDRDWWYAPYKESEE